METDEEFDARWVTYFSKPDIDAWELKKGDLLMIIENKFALLPKVCRFFQSLSWRLTDKKNDKIWRKKMYNGVCLNPIPHPIGMNTLIGYDLVPEPKILDSALRACRRLNDLASAIRILEAVKVSYTASPTDF